MTSRAEIYRRKCEEAGEVYPDSFHAGGLFFQVDRSGNLFLKGVFDTIDQKQALALRDWLTDTFDEEGSK